MARELSAEVWEDVDNYEESFGTEMETVVYDEDLKPGKRALVKLHGHTDYLGENL